MITTLSSLINAAVPGLTPGTNVQRPLSASSTKRPLAGSIARACYALVSANVSTTFAGGLVYYDKYFNPVIADRSQEATVGLGAASGNIQQLLSTGDAQQWQSVISPMADTSTVIGTGATQFCAAQCINSGEFGNAVTDVFSNSTASSVLTRYTASNVKQLLNAAFVNSDHSNKAIVYTLAAGVFSTSSRVDGLLNFPYIGTQPYTIPGISGSMVGSASYNAVTNTLVALCQQGSGGQFNLITYQGLNLNAFPSPAVAFAQPGVISTTRAISLASDWNPNDNESYYQIKPILCDNGTVFVSVMFTSQGFCLYQITDGTTIPVVVPVIYKALTTSYGASQGTAYGQRQLQSRDGGAVISYCVYYYFGSGVETLVVDKRNSTYAVSTQLDSASSGPGFNILPYGDSGFAMYICGNAYATNYTGGYVCATLERNGPGGTLTQRNGTFYLPYFPQPNITNYPAMTQVTDYALLDDEYLI